MPITEAEVEAVRLAVPCQFYQKHCCEEYPWCRCKTYLRLALIAAAQMREQELASKKQCSCPEPTYRAVLAGGTCGMGGCPGVRQEKRPTPEPKP